jgi:hypothetical protein
MPYRESRETVIRHASRSRPANIALDLNRGVPLSRQLESLGEG